MRVNSNELVPAIGEDGFKLNKSRNYETAQNSGFDQILSAAETKEAVKEAPKAEPKEKPKLEEKPKDEPIQPKEEPVKEEEPKQPEEKTKEPEKKTETDKPVEKTEVKEKPKADPKEELNEKIVAEIAQVLNIPVEKLNQWLGELKLTPADLADPKNVAALLQKMLDLPTAAALLTSPEFPKLFKAVNEAMAGFKPMLEKLAATAEPETQTVKAFNMENVKAETTEDGEVEVNFTAGEQQTAAQETNVLADEEVPVEAEAETENVETRPQATTQTGTASTGTQTENPLLGQNNVNPIQLEAEQQEIAINTQTNAVQNQTTVAKTVETARAANTSVVDANDVMNQIVSRIRTAGDSFSEIRLTLKPENLGDISLRVTTQNGIVTAQFMAESQRVKEIIEANFNMLRGALTEQGINFSELSVSVRQNDQDRANQFEQGRQSSRARIQRISGMATEAEEIPEEAVNEIVNGNVNIRV